MFCRKKEKSYENQQTGLASELQYTDNFPETFAWHGAFEDDPGHEGPKVSPQTLSPTSVGPMVSTKVHGKSTPSDPS